MLMPPRLLIPRTWVPPMPTTQVSMPARATALCGERGFVDSLGGGAEFGDEAFAHAAGDFDAVAAIAEDAVLEFGDEDARICCCQRLLL